ncbi:MAG: hypothetical protein JWR63_1774 [Conexibacter sp.]|nr:hypothetical protein [Conexibacter sp.]MCW2999901.1 hypothetical protein [Solirubrobacterales bacterium]
MITTVVLSGSAVIDLRAVTGSPDEDLLIALNRRFLDLLLRHGILTGSTEELRRLNAATDALDDDDRAAWQELLVHLERNRRLFAADQPPPPSCLDDAAALSDVSTLVPHGEHVAVVDTTRAAVLGLTPRVPATDVAGQEVVRSRSCTESPRLRNLEALALRHMHPAGVTRNQFFREVLRPLAEVSQEVLIADRYLFTELEHRAGRSNARLPEHVGWLLDQLGKTSLPDTKVILAGGVGEGGQPADLRAAAQRVFEAWGSTRGRVTCVEVRTAHWPDFSFRSQLAHDRHIAFDCGFAIQMLAGFNRLRDKTLWDPNGTSWSYVTDPQAFEALRDAEQRIRQADGSASTQVS